MAAINRTPVREWYDGHDYGAVVERLGSVREVMLNGDVSEAAENLRRSYYFAVLSIRTTKDIHERAFELWVGGMSIEDAMVEAGVNFWKNKLKWIRRTEADVNWVWLVAEIRANVRGGTPGELMKMCDQLTGVAFAKWGFTIALAGVWEVICIDSNVKNYYGLDDKINFRSKSGVDRYFDIVEMVQDDVPADVPPFVAQWVIYDHERGEHATHDVYFDAAYPFAGEDS